jgi:hypothetical protein
LSSGFAYGDIILLNILRCTSDNINVINTNRYITNLHKKRILTWPTGVHQTGSSEHNTCKTEHNTKQQGMYATLKLEV